MTTGSFLDSAGICVIIMSVYVKKSYLFILLAVVYLLGH